MLQASRSGISLAPRSQTSSQPLPSSQAHPSNPPTGGTPVMGVPVYSVPMATAVVGGDGSSRSARLDSSTCDGVPVSSLPASYQQGAYVPPSFHGHSGPLQQQAMAYAQARSQAPPHAYQTGNPGDARQGQQPWHSTPAAAAGAVAQSAHTAMRVPAQATPPSRAAAGGAVGHPAMGVPAQAPPPSRAAAGLGAQQDAPAARQPAASAGAPATGPSSVGVPLPPLQPGTQMYSNALFEPAAGNSYPQQAPAASTAADSAGTRTNGSQQAVSQPPAASVGQDVVSIDSLVIDMPDRGGHQSSAGQGSQSRSLPVLPSPNQASADAIPAAAAVEQSSGNSQQAPQQSGNPFA